MLYCKRGLLLCLLLLIYVHPALSATTGKIAGMIKDKESGEFLPGANVMLEGTTLGAAAGLNGHYAILNVPPGIYTLRVSMMGYSQAVIEGVRVRIDLTTTINIELSQTVIEGEEVVTVAEREIIQKDMTSSLASVSAEELEALPVQSINQVLQLQAGVIREGSNLHVRGGRGREVAYWVDGVNVTDLNGNRGVTVENAAIQEMQLVSGTFNAEYGRAMSGIVNIATKDGGQNYHGEISAYIGDYVSNSDKFDVMDSWGPSSAGQARMVSTTSNPLIDRLNLTADAQGSLSGPVPFTKKRLNFFANVRYTHSEGYHYGRRFFTPQGLPGDSALVPLQPSQNLTGQFKLSYKINPNMKLNYTLFTRKNDQERSTGTSQRYVPDAGRQSHSNGQTHIMTLTHTLSQNTFYDLKLCRFSSNAESYLYDDPYNTPLFNRIKIFDADGNLVDERMFSTDNEKKQILSWVTEQENYSYLYAMDPSDTEGFLHPDSNAISRASASFEHMSTPLNFSFSEDSYWLGKVDFTSQISRLHQLKFGGEAILYTYDREYFTLRPKAGDDGRQIEPFVPYIEDISTIYHDDYAREPRLFAAYFQDKMEYQDIIMNIGLRFDYFDANTVMPVDPTDPNIYDPYTLDWRYKDFDADEYSALVSQKEKEAYIDDRTEYTADERRDFMHKKVNPKMQIGPRLGIAYPITDKGVIHFSYGHFFQMPQASYLYSRPDFKITSGQLAVRFGNPDLNAERRIMYEIGLQQQLADNLGMDVTLFYSDIRDWVGVSPQIITQHRMTTNYYQWENKDYANVRGITLSLNKRYARNFSATLDYTFQIAEGTYSDPNDAYNAVTGGKEPAKQLVPLDYDRRHLLNGTFAYRNKGWIVSLIGRFQTGRPYTPTPVATREAAGGSSYIGWQENIARLPNWSQVDLLIDKKIFTLGRTDHRLFFRIYNVFDQRAAVGVYSDTGSPDYNTTTTHALIRYDQDRIGSLEHWLLRPGNYQAPRLIQLGYRLGF